MSAEDHAKTVVNQLGWEKETIGNFKHKMFFCLNSMWPISRLLYSINYEKRVEKLDGKNVERQESNLRKKNDEENFDDFSFPR